MKALLSGTWALGMKKTTTRPLGLLPVLLLLALPAATEAQFDYTTNNGAISITGCRYPFPGGWMTIPATITGLPVTSIGNFAFMYRLDLTGVTIPGSVTSIGGYAFYDCYWLASATIGDGVTNIWDYAFYSSGLTSITLPNSVTGIGDAVFRDCGSLTNVTVGSGLTSIGEDAFQECTSLASVTIGNGATCIAGFSGCSSLASVTIPASVTNVGQLAFFYSGLTSVFFQGDAPRNVGADAFEGDNATAYYLPGTTGWGPTFCGLPTMLWNPQFQTGGAGSGLRSNQFGFTIAGTAGLAIVVEACTGLANPSWYPLQTNTLAGGSFYFADPHWTNYASRFYRLRPP